MGWKLKAAVSVAVALLIVGIACLGFFVYARYQANEYAARVAASFNAAALLNGEETYTEPDRAVISVYEGRRYVVLPENYKAIVSLLRKDCAMPLVRRVGKDAPLTITVCDSARLAIEPDRDSGDGVLISFAADTGKRFAMHARGGNIWKQLVGYATVGHSGRRNVPLQGEAGP